MAKTTEVISLRVSKMLLKEIESAIESRNERTSKEPYARNRWIIEAIRDKLKHLRRSRARNATPLYDLGGVGQGIP